jgi:alanine racemase
VRSTPSSSSEPREAALASDWLHISVDTVALRRNMMQFRELVPPPVRLLAVVKADAYGHGLVLASRAFREGGADLLGVHALAEALALRRAELAAPLLILGPLTRDEAAAAAQLDAEFTVASLEAACAAADAARDGSPGRVHLKVETGVYRQGVGPRELDAVLEILESAPGLQLVGLSSHFADIEDTTDHTFAQAQQRRFTEYVEALSARGHRDLCLHMSCSAAAILWPDTHHGMARVGISAYGIWPSRETLVSARAMGRNALTLQPALTWQVRISQIKTVPGGETVGYGRTWKAPVDTRLAVLPVGYADGYPRVLSNRAHVLIGGRRAPIRGRICMNLCMADVTHVPEAAAGDEAVLLGRQGDETLRAEDLAEWAGTIAYEVLTWPGSTWSRAAV